MMCICGISNLFSYEKAYGFFVLATCEDSLGGLSKPRRRRSRVKYSILRIRFALVNSEHLAMSLECIQLGHHRGSSQLALQCCKQPLPVFLFKVKLMCRRRGEDLKEDQLMRVALPCGLEHSFTTALSKLTHDR